MKDPARLFLIHSRKLLGLVSSALLTLAAALTLTACRSSAGFEQTFAPGASRLNSETNLLREGDVVSITFQNSTNLNTTQKIPLDGLLNLENVGTVKAAGKSPEDFQGDLARLYGPQTRNDPITVKLIAAATAVYVAGAVSHPGRVPMERPMTALEAVMEAGGFDPARAKLSAVTVLRIAEGRQRTFHVDLKRVIEGRDDSPFYLKPFDIVHVPSRTFNF
jgi:polysaccharide export outer membrane protein